MFDKWFLKCPEVPSSTTLHRCLITPSSGWARVKPKAPQSGFKSRLLHVLSRARSYHIHCQSAKFFTCMLLPSGPG